MAKTTPATLALEKAGVAFTPHEYDYDPNAERIGMQAAEALGIEPARLLKTLMARTGGRGSVVPTQNSECRRNSRISLVFGVLSRDRSRGRTEMPPKSRPAR
jgi:hypothetical protein